MADESDSPLPFDIAALGHSLRKQAPGSAERDAYLEKLRKLVKKGEYQIDSEALAKKLIEEAEGYPESDHCADDEAK